MLEEGVTNQEEVLVLTWQSALVDHKVALFVAGLVQVLLRVDFEDIIRHLESNWLDLRSDIFARVSDMAESLVRGAVKIW